MYFRSQMLEINKTIHFWNLQSMGNKKINVGICVITCMADILAAIKYIICAVLAASQLKTVIQYANPVSRVKKTTDDIITLLILTLSSL